MISRMCTACTLLYSLHGDYVRADSRRLTLLHYSLCDASASIHRHPHTLLAHLCGFPALLTQGNRILMSKYPK